MRTDHRSRDQGDDVSHVRPALRRFALLGGTVVVTVVIGVFLASSVLAESEARRDAAVRATGMANGLAKPFVDADFRSGDPEAVARLDAVLRGRIQERGVEHIVLWDADARVLWADDRAVMETELEAPSTTSVRQALGSMGPVVRLPGDAATEAASASGESELLEVYVGVTDSDGVPFVFEAQLPDDRIALDAQAVQWKLLLLTLAALVVVLAAMAPLAVSLARRVDDAQRARTRALDRSVASWRHQRRLLAQELHDGVIQDLAAIGYGISVLGDREAPDPTSRVVLERLRAASAHAETSLRSMVMDLAPKRLGEDGLELAARELVDRYRGYGLDIDLDVADRLDAPEGSGILAFRALREGLRNVVKHSDARRVRVSLRSTHAGGLEVEVSDDGCGSVGPDSLRSGQGLRLLADTVADTGGVLTLQPSAEGGTTLHAVVPRVSAEPGRP